MQLTPKPIITFLDFDDTCFNTRILKQKLIQAGAKALEPYLTHSNLHQQAALLSHSLRELKRLRINPNLVRLSQILLLEISRMGYAFSAPQLTRIEHALEQAFEQALQHSHDLIFPEVPAFLSYATKNHWKLVLLTHGDPEFQQAKVKAAGLDIIEAIFVTNHNKADAIKAWLNWKQLDPANFRLLFIDDKPRYLTQVSALFPMVSTYQIDRSHPKLSDRLVRTVVEHRTRPKSAPPLTPNLIHNLLEVVD